MKVWIRPALSIAQDEMSYGRNGLSTVSICLWPLLAAIFLLASALNAETLSTQARIAQYMGAQVSVNRFSGSILVAQNGKVLENGQYGLGVRTNQNDEPGQKTYRLGSISKQFTAAAILQLVDRGELRLEDSVCKYLPECPSNWREISISNLLTQTDAIPALTDTETRGRYIGPEELLNLLYGKALAFRPGQEFSSSDSGYAILGVIIENVSHEPYQKYLKDHIFRPLEMDHTGINATRKKASRDFLSVQPIGSVTPIDIVATWPYNFGRVRSTARDLYRWDLALNTNKVISTKSADEMFSPHIDGYGFGWAIYWEFGRQVDIQSGGLNLVSSSIRRYPNADSCVIVLSNRPHVDAGRIGRDLAAILFSKEYELPKRHRRVKVDSSVFDAYLGHYEMSQGLDVLVTRKGDRLLIQGAGQKKIELLPESKVRFFVKGISSEVTFVKGMNGKAGELILQQGGRDIPALRNDE